MTDEILVLNARSSSVKFSVFTVGADELALALSGQLEGIYTAPRFAARDAIGAQIDACKWGEGTRIGTAASRVAACVIPAKEELMIARHTRALLAADALGLRS